MERKVKTILAVAIVAVVVVCSAFYYSQLTNPDLETRARDFVNFLRSEESEKAYSLFNNQMAEAISLEDLRTIWSELEDRVGSYKGIVATKTETEMGYRVIYVTTEFEETELDIKVVFDSEAKIAGLWFIEFYSPPEYADPDSFTEVELVIGSEEWALPATLTLPNGEGPFPAVILVHGSGPNDRDETIGPNKPFKDLAWGLATRSIAVLRYEKRTKEHSEKVAEILENFTVNDETVDDALAAAKVLLEQSKISPNRISVLGHSLGGMLAPRIGISNETIAGLIILAGNTRDLQDLLLDQAQYLALLDGKIDDAESKQLEEIEEGARKIRELDIGEGEIVFGASRAYWEDLSQYDPVETAKELDIRILILQGERDYQVTMEDFQGWNSSLHSYENVEFKVYPTLNHLFIEGEGKSTPNEYFQAGNIAEIVMRDIASWIENQSA